MGGETLSPLSNGISVTILAMRGHAPYSFLPKQKSKPLPTDNKATIPDPMLRLLFLTIGNLNNDGSQQK